MRIPRLYIPSYFTSAWAVPACDSTCINWEQVAHGLNGAPSALSFFLPQEAFEEEDEGQIALIHENMYAALEEENLFKLERGFMLTERETSQGVRRGILACIDLEEYGSLIRPSKECKELSTLVKLRAGAPLEFPHATVFYHDKKDKIMRSLVKLIGEDLEDVYDTDLVQGGGQLKGYFIPEDLSVEVAQALMNCANPCFVVADGNASVAGAKAYWDKIKTKISQEERRNHPARFTLVEMVNAFDKAVSPLPVHRLLKDTDAEAFCEFFTSRIKCKRVGNLLFPAYKRSVAGVMNTDTLIAEYLKVNEGRVEYFCGEDKIRAKSLQEGCVGVVTGELEKEEIFTVFEEGKTFTKKVFALCEEREKRYHLEGREISYD